MVRDGIFPWEEETHEVVEEQVLVNSDVCSVHVAVKRTQEAPVRKRVPQSAKLPAILFRAVVEVLTSPIRLSLLFLMTVFIMLNRK